MNLSFDKKYGKNIIHAGFIHVIFKFTRDEYH